MTLRGLTLAVYLPPWTVAVGWLVVCWVAVGVDEWRKRLRLRSSETVRRRALGRVTERSAA